MRYQLRALASFLPDRLLRWLGRHWLLCYDPDDGWTFWIDASYAKYIRKEKRHIPSP